MKKGDLVTVKHPGSKQTLCVVWGIGRIKPVKERDYKQTYVWVSPLDPAERAFDFEGLPCNGFYKEYVHIA